jgi:histone H2B
VLKQVHPGTGISSKAVSILESVCDDVLDQLATQGADLARGAKGHTLGSREILSATKLVLPGQLGAHAQTDGAKAVQKFMGTVKKSETKRKPKKASA